MDRKFDKLDDMYDLLLPALEVKEIQLRRSDYLGISKKDIWNYLKETKWSKDKGLRLHKMVNDIMIADNDAIISHNEI